MPQSIIIIIHKPSNVKPRSDILLFSYAYGFSAVPCGENRSPNGNSNHTHVTYLLIPTRASETADGPGWAHGIVDHALPQSAPLPRRPAALRRQSALSAPPIEIARTLRADFAQLVEGEWQWMIGRLWRAVDAKGLLDRTAELVAQRGDALRWQCGDHGRRHIVLLDDVR
eukprot:7276795-Prymnesium_polylepis.2